VLQWIAIIDQRSLNFLARKDHLVHFRNYFEQVGGVRVFEGVGVHYL